MTKKYQSLQDKAERWAIRARRAGLNNKELAKLAGISEQQFSKIKCGHAKDPRMSTIDNIERVLNSKGV